MEDSESLFSQSLGGTKKKKKRTVIVVKKFEKRSPKKEVFVSRKLKDGDDKDLEESFLGNSSAQRPTKDSAGEILNRSILGDPKTFAMYEEHNDGSDSSPTLLSPPGRGGSRKTMARGSSVDSNAKVVDTKKDKKVAMVTDSQNYVDSLKRLKMTAHKLRAKEREKEENLIQYLPVNERFDLNKEGKVLAMWQERQKKWDKIQKSLSKKVNVNEANLLMSTADDFRTRNEEYDLLQAAIPVHERFGADSWEMQLRGGTEKAVTIGHIFSGLSCNVSVKRATPATLRKPKKSRGPGKTTQFIGAFPSLKSRQKQLKKALQTLRPHSMSENDVDSLVISSKNLFDWAIDSSVQHMNEQVDNNYGNVNGENADDDISLDDYDRDVFVESEPTSTGPQINFESSRTILFNALQNETSKSVVTFVNSGSTALEYSWKKIATNMESELVDTFGKRKCVLREHELSEKRPVFFCSCPNGQILPGQEINTIFLFNSKGCGGYFREAWMLDTSPKAIVVYPNRLTRTASMDGVADGRSAQPLPSAVYVKLKGYAATLDENQHRRDASLHTIDQNCIRANVSDAIYNSIRYVRKPVTMSDLEDRKLRLFKAKNASTIMTECECCVDESSINLTFSRFQSFTSLANDVITFSEKVSSLENDKAVEAGIDSIPSIKNCLNDPTALRELRDLLLPEVSLSSFDEISEDMLWLEWDLNLATLSDELRRLETSSQNIKKYENIIETNRIAAEKKRISAERRAADSDYESEEDDEEDEEDDEELSIQQEHELVLHCAELKNRLCRMYYMLSIRTLPSIESRINAAIGNAIDNYEEMRSEVIDSIEQKGKFEPAPIPNPFSEEGVSFWDDLLIIPTDPAEITRRAKAGTDKDPKRKFFIGLYEKVSNSLLHNLASSLSEIDGELDVCAKSEIEQNKSFESLSDVAALRPTDMESMSSKGTVFMGFNGRCFSTEFLKSAFNFSNMEQREAVSPILEMASFGVKSILLLHETHAPSAGDTVKTTSQKIQHVLTKEDAILAEEKDVKEGRIHNYSVVPCATIPELIRLMQSTARSEDVVKVYYLENLSSTEIVPTRSDYVEYLSDDDEAPIPIGLEDSRKLKRKAWEDEGPQKILTSITLNKKQSKVSCYTDAGYAIRDIFQEGENVWVEACSVSFIDTPALSKIKAHRILSSRLRDLLLWVSTIQNMRNSNVVLKQIVDEEEQKAADDPVEQVGEIAPKPMDFCRRFGNLFPPSHTLTPAFIASIGGTLKPGKMKLLEHLIDFATKIIICGEVCIPFVACTSGVAFTQHEQICSDYRLLCGLILKKAKLRGVEILLPDDLVVGDEPLSHAQLQQCFANVDDSARDEGADYEGESGVISLQPVDDKGVIVTGFVYDIGPSSCDAFTKAISSCQLHLSWGTVGCSEISSFQSGQRAIVAAASPQLNPEEDTDVKTEVTLPTTPHNIVIGSSNVEWWARIADPEGEFEGHLTKMGVADYVSLDSNAMCYLLSNRYSTALENVLRRPPTDAEWDYLTALRHEDDEEDEEEEEEDDEDED